MTLYSRDGSVGDSKDFKGKSSDRSDGSLECQDIKWDNSIGGAFYPDSLYYYKTEPELGEIYEEDEDMILNDSRK